MYKSLLLTVALFGFFPLFVDSAYAQSAPQAFVDQYARADGHKPHLIADWPSWIGRADVQWEQRSQQRYTHHEDELRFAKRAIRSGHSFLRREGHDYADRMKPESVAADPYSHSHDHDHQHRVDSFIPEPLQPLHVDKLQWNTGGPEDSSVAAPDGWPQWIDEPRWIWAPGTTKLPYWLK